MYVNSAYVFFSLLIENFVIARANCLHFIFILYLNIWEFVFVFACQMHAQCVQNNIFVKLTIKHREPITNTAIHPSIYTLYLQLFSFVFPENCPIKASMYGILLKSMLTRVPHVLQCIAMCDAVTWNRSHQNIYTHSKD